LYNYTTTNSTENIKLSKMSSGMHIKYPFL